MMTFDNLKAERDLVNRIDWTMTPEKAVDMYLEWGASWTRGNDFVKNSSDESIYFVIYDWENPAQVTLLRRSARDVEELCKVEVPEDLARQSIAEAGFRPGVGVYPLSRNLKRWLSDVLSGPPVDMGEDN